MAYTCQLKPGWVRGVATPKAGLAVTGLTLVDAFGIPIATQCTPFNWWPDGSIRHALLIARITQAGAYTLAYDPLPLTLPAMPTPVWPRASVTFTDNGVTYNAFLPAFTDSDPWTTGPLAIERSVVLVPISGNTPHPLVQVVADVCSYVDGSTRLVFGLTNARDTTAQARVSMGRLAITIGDTTIYPPQDHVLYEGQYGIQIGFAGGHLSSRLHPDSEMWFDAGVFPRVMPVVENPTYTPTYVMGGFMDMSVSMPLGGGRPELGPVLTKAQAEYTIHRTDAIYDQVIAQAMSGGSWSGDLLDADGVTLTIDPDRGNKSNAGYGQFYMLEGAHLIDVFTMAFVLTGDRCYLRLMQAWGEEVMEGVWGGPANPTSYSGGAAAVGTFLDYDYSKHVDGNLCFLGASGFAEPRFIGRVLRTITNAATFTPKAQTALKAKLATVVNQNVARLDVSYARRPAFGPFNPPGAEFDPGVGLGNGYGAVHALCATMSFWQWYEVAMALYHAYRHGYTTDLSMLKRICGSLLKIWETCPPEKYRYLASLYYPRIGRKVVNGPVTPFATFDEFFTANWVTPPGGAWDGDDNGGQPGPLYYALEYYTLLSLAKWLGLTSPVLDAALAYMRPLAMNDAPARGHYAFLIGDDSIVVTAPPPATTPDPPPATPPPVTPPQGSPTRTLTLSLSTTQTETNVDPSTLSYRISVPIVVPAVAHPQTRVSYATTDGKAVIGPFSAGQLVPLKVIANNVGPGDASGVTVTPDIQGGAIVAAESPDFDVATGVWHVGALPHSTPDTERSKHIDVTVKVQE